MEPFTLPGWLERLLRPKGLVPDDLPPGTADKPLILEKPDALSPRLLRRIRHLHGVDGRCVKNDFGPLCNAPTVHT